MSLCYDFQKWTMITFASVAVSLTIGLLLINFAHGYLDPEPYTSDTDLYDQITYVNSLETFVDYCFQHADRPNPLQDLKDKGFSVIYSDCKQVNRIYTEQADWLAKMMVDYNKNKLKQEKEDLYKVYNKTNSNSDQINSNQTYQECLEDKTTTFEECIAIKGVQIK